MNYITCPKCGEMFNVDDASYARIVQQVRDREFWREINRREEQLQFSNERDVRLAVAEAERKSSDVLAKKDALISDLQTQLSTKDLESQLKEQSLKQTYEMQLKLKDEQIEQIRDFRNKQSTKMVGESLEQHCMMKFNELRMGAFPRAYFEKDNDAKTGSKGDFIFRESDEDGTEFISIMFEMKNEIGVMAR